MKNDKAPKTRRGLFAVVLVGGVVTLGFALRTESTLPNQSAQPQPAVQPIEQEPIPSEALQKVQFPYGVDQSDPDNFAAVMDLAERGNYQAQRNIAYGFSVDKSPYHSQQHNPVLGCAWYLVVLNLGSNKVDSTDQENANLWCGKLDEELLHTSKYQASKIMNTIAEKTKFGKLDN